ncbi:hypothetical protein, partial [Microbacterium aurum]
PASRGRDGLSTGAAARPPLWCSGRVAGCWLGSALRASVSGLDNGSIPFDRIIDALRLAFTVTWSDGDTE